MNNQAYLFLIFSLNGFIIGVLFDFFRILRKSFKTSDIATYIEDILFWILTGVTILYTIFVFNNGEIRLYMFLGLMIGVTLYMLILSKYIIKVSVYIMNTMKKTFIYIIKIIFYPFKIIYKVLKRIFIKPISFIFINIRKNMTKIYNVFEINTKKMKTFIIKPKNKVKN